MYNLHTNFVKNLEICKQFSHNLINEQGNRTLFDPISKFYNLEILHNL